LQAFDSRRWPASWRRSLWCWRSCGSPDGAFNTKLDRRRRSWHCTPQWTCHSAPPFVAGLFFAHLNRCGARTVRLGNPLQLHKEMGRVVPHEKLCSIVMGSSRARDMRNLQTHAIRINGRLAARRLPLAVAVVREVGYALCEIAR
jgi:hypothetical protein